MIVYCQIIKMNKMIAVCVIFELLIQKKFMTQKIDKEKMLRIKQEAAKLGTSYYKFIEPFIININDRIGKGSYGEVYKGADIRDGNLVAVKTISTSNIKKDPQKFYESLKNEIEIMKSLKCENIVGLLDVKKSANNIYLFQELCNKGSLEDVLNKRKKIPEIQAFGILKQLINGYKYLHEHSIIHRDLKPANILIKDETYKIADFGFAKYYSEGNQLAQIQQSLVGSPIYMCPQILNGSNYSTKSDVWSMGIIFYQMVYGKTPHRAGSLEELVMKVNKKVIRYPQKLNNEKLQQLLDSMLKYSPQERISWKQIFEHELFKPKPIFQNNIKQSRRIAQTVSKNPMQMSTKLNEIYFQDKKVLQKIDLTQNEQEEMNIANVVLKNVNEQKDLYKSIAQKYEETEVKKNIIRQIKNWFLFKRNKAVFLNHLSLRIHHCFAMEKLEIPLSQAEIFILVLSKWQCLLTYKSFVRLKECKLNSKAFTDEEYQLFVKSPFREKIMEKFKNDFTVMKMFFDELVKKVEGYINDQKPPLPEKLVRIKKICNPSVCPKELFAQIYAQSIDELQTVCRQSLKSYPKSRDLLQLTYLVIEASKLKNSEMDTPEFSMIYDQEEKMTDAQLLDKIEGRAIEE